MASIYEDKINRANERAEDERLRKEWCLEYRPHINRDNEIMLELVWGNPEQGEFAWTTVERSIEILDNDVNAALDKAMAMTKERD